jgi:hypothetical protein
VKPFYLSNRSTFQIQRVPLLEGNNGANRTGTTLRTNGPAYGNSGYGYQSGPPPWMGSLMGWGFMVGLYKFANPVDP